MHISDKKTLIISVAEARFWAKVQLGKPDECWPWIAANNGRYGRMRWRDKLESAHRISYFIHYEESVCKGTYICHHCDNPSCVNPRHLYLGSALSNNHDTLNRKRRPKRYRKPNRKKPVPDDPLLPH